MNTEFGLVILSIVYERFYWTMEHYESCVGELVMIGPPNSIHKNFQEKQSSREND